MAEEKKPKEVSKETIYLAFGLLAAFFLFFGYSQLKGPSPAPQRSAEEQARVDKHGESPAKFQFKDAAVSLIKKSAKDPNSVEVYGVSEVFYNKKDGWICELDWGAKNSFGGMVRSRDWFVISNGIIRKANGTYN